ncbi:hypothetical protein NUW58_g3040 [Xylaria curta]|uniref:Uncharacterized protein n=1 Tax=Xylaria curta TaxID=42375 RepID=A0ACC1PCT1_9PEZI|nr:hypothetical protein NUW58_g3040 [Xylaria curta]
MSELHFPLFDQLPFELRRMIWTEYALPRGPMLHSISYGYSSAEVILCSFATSDPDSACRVNVLNLPTTRALMQVNREAREAVLDGRQLQRVVDNDQHSINVFHGGFHSCSNGRIAILHRYFFVNWGIDMFYFREGLHISMHNILEQSCLQRMKRIAIEIRGPTILGRALCAPRYSPLFGISYMKKVVPLPSCDLTRANLASVGTIFLVLDFNTVRGMYAFENAPEESRTEVADQNEENPSERGEPLHYESTDEILDSDDECDYTDWICDLFIEREFGFHHVSPNPDRYSMKPLCLWGRQDTLKREKISFEDWVGKMISGAQKDCKNFCGRSVDIQMVMDPFGGYDWMITSYDRVNIGFTQV